MRKILWNKTGGPTTYICARCFGTINRSSPTNAFPVARTRFSPLAVRGISEEPVCLPERDHSVSPCRTMKQRGLVMASHGVLLSNRRNGRSEESREAEFNLLAGRKTGAGGGGRHHDMVFCFNPIPLPILQALLSAQVSEMIIK